MKAAYIDTNIIVRLLTNDPPEMADRVEELFRLVREGQIEVIVEEIVIAETVWVLLSSYNLSAVQIAARLQEFLVIPGVVCHEETEVLPALVLYGKKNIDFADALLAVKMGRSGVRALYSFDKHFDRLESVRRLEP